MKNKNPIKALLFAALLTGASASFAQTIKTSAGSGAWTTGSTWSPSGAPATGDSVVIAAGHTVTAAGITRTGAVTVNGTLSISNANFTAGSLSGSGTLTVTGVTGTTIRTLAFGSLNSNTTFSGTITGKARLRKTGTGTLTLNGSGGNTYTGNTEIQGGGKIKLGSANRIPNSSTVEMCGNSTLDLNGYNDTIAGLSSTSGTCGSGTGHVVTNSSSTQVTLTIELLDGGFGSFDGAITGKLNLVLSGGGNFAQQDLGGANTYTGTTAVSGGILNIIATNAIPSATDITITTPGQMALNANATCNKLTLGTALQFAATYGSSVSAATTKNDTYFDTIGTGVLTATSGLSSSCQSGTVVWDGGGSDEKYSTSANWVGDLCPCRGAKILFNATGTNTKNCVVDSSITHSSITLNRGYRGRLIVNDTCKLTLDSLITNAPMVVFSVGAKKSDIGVIHISNNGVVNCAANAGLNIGRLNLGLAGFISFRSKSSVNIGTLWMDEYAQFKGPQDGNTYLTGNLTIANRTTFDAADGKLHFTGTTNQNVDVFSANQLNATAIVVNKSSGAVVLQRNLSCGNLTLTSGNINTGSNTITLTSDRGVFGGSSSSYINGKVALNHASAWAGSKFRIPLGQGSKYRPITLHNTSSSNIWAVEFVNSDPNTLGSAAAPLDAISADGYWTANRTAGGGGLLADATYFEISDAGKGAWNNSDLRVARLATTWNDLGGTYLSSSVISTSTSLNTNDNFSIALGVDNASPAPVFVTEREDVSGNEIATSKSVKKDAVQQHQTIAFGVYPNPVSETLFIALNGADKGNVVVSDMSGKVLGVYNVAETRSINMRNLSAGVYFATFTDGINRITQRVVRD
jgi:autotransporter-associated beta strand protein